MYEIAKYSMKCSHDYWFIQWLSISYIAIQIA